MSIIEYDRRADASVDEKLISLIESIQRALNTVDGGCITGTLDGSRVQFVKIDGGSLSGIIDGNYVFLKNLDAEQITTGSIDAERMTAGVIDAVNAAIGTIDADKINVEDLTTDYLDADYAQIDAANVTDLTAQTEWVNKILVQTGLLANSGQIYTLDAIQVNATNITAGTIDIERIVVTDSTTGEKHMVTWNSTSQEWDSVKLDGDVIEDLTITADKIVSGAIMTRHITTQDIEGTSGWINLRNGTFFYGTGASLAASTNGISWDGTDLNMKVKDLNIVSGNTNIDVANTITGTAADLAAYILQAEGEMQDLQAQIDGAIETWYYEGTPTTANAPASSWTTEEQKNQHLRDLYFDTLTGHSFRWAMAKTADTSIVSGKDYYTYNSTTGVYTKVTSPTAGNLGNYYEFKWIQIEDADAIKALADAAAAQDTADHKRRVFVATPTVPYDVGDLWVQGTSGDIMRCQTAKTSSQSYSSSDWVKASKYTDDSSLNTWLTNTYASDKSNLEGLIDEKIETFYQTSDPSTNWTSAEKTSHTGDIWYNSTSNVQKYYRWSGSAWTEITATPPKAVMDTVDGKAVIFTGSTTPTDPNEGDLWFKGANEPILTYVNNAWVVYNKYTDDTAVTNFSSRFTVTPENISSEVTALANGSEIATRINQTANTVQIQASKVDIAGAVIITSGRLSQSSLDSAYDANGAASSAQAAAIAAIPTTVSSFTNDSGYQTSSDVDDAVGELQTTTEQSLSELSNAMEQSMANINEVLSGTVAYSDGTHDVLHDEDGYFYDSGGTRVDVDETDLLHEYTDENDVTHVLTWDSVNEYYYYVDGDETVTVSTDAAMLTTHTVGGTLQDIDSLTSNVQTLSGTVSNYGENIDAITGRVSTAEATLSDITPVIDDMRDMIILDPDGTVIGLNEPAIEVKCGTNNVLITAERISFNVGDNEVAYFSQDTMHITQAEIEDNMRIGDFVWDDSGSGRINLRYVPQS